MSTHPAIKFTPTPRRWRPETGTPARQRRNSPSAEEIERLIAERNEMRRKGNYARSDEIRQNLQKAGVIIEDSKAGTRWKRK